MSSIDCAKSSYVAIKANDIPDAFSVSGARVRNVIQLFAVVLGAALLAACAQSSVVTRNSEFVGSSRQASLQHNRTASFVTNRRVASAKKHTPFARHNNAAPTQIASQGIASFYTEGQQTASGEKFDTHDFTAAHPTLPFGTRLRVTNVATGRSQFGSMTAVRTFPDESSMSHILRPMRWEWLEVGSQRSNLTSSNS